MMSIVIKKYVTATANQMVRTLRLIAMPQLQKSSNLTLITEVL